MKKRAAFLLTVLIFAALCAAMACAQTDWRNAYAPIVRQANESRAERLITEYYVYDMDGDGTPELLLPEGSCEADAMLRIYGMENSEAALRYEAPFSHSVACGLSGTNALLVHSGRMGWEQGTLYRLRDGVIFSETAFEAYSDMGDYCEFTPLRGYDFADLTGLNWQSNPSNDNLVRLYEAMGLGASDSATNTETFSSIIGTLEVRAAGGYVRMYPQRNENSGLLRHVFNGTYPCVGRVGDWVAVLCEGDLGYVRMSDEAAFSADGAQAGDVPAIGVVSVTAQNMVNVRAGNNADTALLMCVCPDASFLCVGIDAQTDWYEILLPTGQTGYISPKLAELAEG